ncbi:major capsid protein [Aeromicrobium sp. UC242_57]|uniref:major capsid protein n=1 Tax=Aeromicrobium sp. UC242_57 TaxID=3374624 RepID=UPI0037AFA43D
MGQNIPVSEYDQLRTRGASEDVILTQILSTARQVAQAVSDRVERVRAVTLRTGVATIAEIGGADDFGRSGTHTVTASSLWSSATSVSRLTDLQTWCDTYEATNGVTPGSIVMSRNVFRLLQTGDEFKTSLIGGGSRRATSDQVNDVIEGEGLPPIEVYTRRTAAGVLDPDQRCFYSLSRSTRMHGKALSSVQRSGARRSPRLRPTGTSLMSTSRVSWRACTATRSPR